MSVALDKTLDVASQVGGAEPSTSYLYDKSRQKHICTLANVTWGQVPYSGQWYMVYDGTTSYAWEAAATGTDMDFTFSNYTIMGWLDWAHGEVSQIIIGRYVLDNNGWEIYLTETGGVFHLTNRHHHAGTIVDTHPRTAYDSVGWVQGVSTFFAITRSGNTAAHYRNGVALATTYSTGGLVDPEPCVQDMTIGIRYTKNANYYVGKMARLRVFNYALTPAQVRARYHAEKYLFGVAS